MSNSAPYSKALLGSLLRDVSRSFYLTLRILPGAVRQQIGLAYLLARATDTIADKYGVEVGEDWLARAQLATTRLENGCTGSFASADGLVLTNNHCTCTNNHSTCTNKY